MEVMKLSRASKRQMKLDRLCSAMRKARTELRVYRENRKRLIRLIAGADYSDNAASLRRPMNMLGMYVNVMSRAIVNQSPKVMLTTWDDRDRRNVWTAQEWSNRQFDRMNLGASLNRWVGDALLLMGIMKVGVVDPMRSEVLGFKNWAGEAYAETISFDDYVLDIFARNMDELSYEGHRYRAPVDTANRHYRLRGENKLSATPDLFNLDGDERASVIGRGFIGGDSDEFGELTDLWEVYLPAHRAVVTFRSEEGGSPSGPDDLIEAREYVGPYCGPYVKLGLIHVPDQLLPKGPVSDLVALDGAMNRIARKLIRQADRCKELTEYTGTAAQDMQRINAASDGDAVQVTRPQEINQRTYSLPNPQLFGLLLQFKQLVSYLGGNMDSIAGLARMAGTASQETQINQSASASLGAMQQQALAKTREVIDNLCWYFWNDPMGVMRATYRPLPSRPELAFPRELGPDVRRQIPWEDLEVKVDPYTMVAESPAARDQFLDGVVNQIAPLLPLFQQLGVQFDPRAWLRKKAEYRNTPDLIDIFQLGDPMPGQMPQGEEQPGKPAVTERTYTRKSESEATPGGQESDAIQQMMGAGATGAGDFEGQ
jgi:hypothetical protein